MCVKKVKGMKKYKLSVIDIVTAVQGQPRECVINNRVITLHDVTWVLDLLEGSLHKVCKYLSAMLYM